MITQKQIVDTYLAYKKRRRTKGEREDNTLPLMPFFIMDCCYQVYCKDIKDLPCKHLMKQAKKKWADNYHKFTTDFFLAFNADQTEYIIDLMDEFNDHINNSVVMLKSAVVNYIPDVIAFEEKKTLGSLMVCNVLAQAAQHLYGEMYRDPFMRKEEDQYIERIKSASHHLSGMFPEARNLELTASTNIMQMVKVLCDNIVKFLRDKEKKS
jgi:hypothetical protein